MNTFWEKVAEKKESIRFYQSTSYSPYCEFSQNWIEEKDGTIKLGINSFYRYDSIMQSLFSLKGIEESWREWLFDIYMHYLTELEYRTGVTIQEVQVRKYWNDLERGIYGQRVKDIFISLSSDDKYYISHTLWKQSKSRETVYKFADVLVTILNGGSVYKNKWNEKQLLFYLNEHENEESKAKVELLQQLFQPLGYNLRILWENHFAVLGEEQTTIIDEIELL